MNPVLQLLVEQEPLLQHPLRVDDIEESDGSGEETGERTAERLRHYVEKLPEILGSFEEEHPEWRIGMLFSLLGTALDSLRGYIERDEEPEISWESPFVEIRFPVDLDCGDPEDALGPNFTVTTGRLEAKDVVDDEAAGKALSLLMVRHLEILALQELTGGSALIKDGENFLPAMPPEIGKSLAGIEDEKERDRALRRFLQPHSFGAGTIDYGELDLETEESCAVPEDVIDQLGDIGEPLVELPLTVEGHKLRLITIFEVHPMVADLDAKSGYFPIVVGLAIQYAGENPPDFWIDEPWASIQNWPDQDRDAAWRAVEGQIHGVLSETLFRKEPELEEAILTVNATIKVMVPKHRGDGRADPIKLATEALAGIGELTQLNVGIARSESSQATNANPVHWPRLLEAVETAKMAKEKGDALENLMAALFSSVPGFSVIQQVRTRSEEIDLWIENDSRIPPFDREGGLILAECKNWQGPAGKDEYVLLREKARNRAGRCTLAFLISWNGAARTVTTEMTRSSRDELIVVPIDSEAIRAAIKEGDFLKTLREARRRALET